MMEVIVAMTIFTVLVTVVLGLTLRTTQVAGTNHRRVEAANLASRQIESVRSLRAVDIPDGGTTRTETVGGTTYTVKQTATYLPADSSSTVCSSSGSSLAYKLVTVTVTWPTMGTTPAVRADTLRTLGAGSDGLDDSTGTLAVLVSGADGSAVEDILVTLSPGGTVQMTGIDGCVVFTGLTPGTYAVTADTSGYVGVANLQLTSSGSAGVTAGGIAHTTLTYDRSRTVILQAAGPSGSTGSTVPSGVPVMIRDSYLSGTNLPTCAIPVQNCLPAFPGTARNLYPAVYDVWTGTCADAGTATSIDLGPAASSGSTAMVAMGEASVDVQVLGVSTPGRTIDISHVADGSCASGEHYTLPNGSQVGGVGILLPFGEWTFSLQGGAPAGPGTVTVTLTGSSIADVTLSSTS